MPRRLVPLITGEFYHIINRGNDSIPIFKTKKNYFLFLATLRYYQNSETPFRFSIFNNLSKEQKEGILSKLTKQRNFQVEIIAYCLMTNHYHFLLRQIKDNGIFNFARLINDSYSRYFNTKYQRRGSLFEGRFKAIRVENEPQLLHLSRYIHLNPFSSFIVRNIEDLFLYPFSSLNEYLNITSANNICNKEVILSHFRTPQKYKKFILDQADYQRNLEKIKHQLLEN